VHPNQTFSAEISEFGAERIVQIVQVAAVWKLSSSKPEYPACTMSNDRRSVMAMFVADFCSAEASLSLPLERWRLASPMARGNDGAAVDSALFLVLTFLLHRVLWSTDQTLLFCSIHHVSLRI
jgi:hypothetical protein